MLAKVYEVISFLLSWLFTSQPLKVPCLIIIQPHFEVFGFNCNPMETTDYSLRFRHYEYLISLTILAS